MIRSVLLWILSSLEQGLDPDLQKRVQALKQKVAAAEAEEKRLQTEIAERQGRNHQLELERSGLQLEIRLQESRIDELIAKRQELVRAAKQAAGDLERLPDRDRVRVDL